MPCFALLDSKMLGLQVLVSIVTPSSLGYAITLLPTPNIVNVFTEIPAGPLVTLLKTLHPGFLDL